MLNERLTTIKAQREALERAEHTVTGAIAELRRILIRYEANQADS